MAQIHDLSSLNAPEKANKRKDRGEEAREQILDVAEALFADRGYFGASIREITDAGGVRLSAVNYHFGSKEALFGQVIKRRAALLNSERLSMLHGPVQGRSREQKVRHVIRAFYKPLLHRIITGDAGWKNYCRLISQVAMNHLWIDQFIAPMFNEAAHEFFAVLRTIAPEADDRAIMGSFEFMMAALLYVFADNGRINSFSSGHLSSSEMEIRTADMEEFCVAGVMRLLCDSDIK